MFVNLSHTILSDVSPELLSSAVRMVDTISIQQTRLTSIQLEALLLNIGTESSLLTSLNLASNDLSKIIPDILSDSLCKLVRVNISNTMLNPDQSKAIFDKISSPESKLKHLIVRDVDLSTCNMESLANGAASLQSINLQLTKLGQQQCRALFRQLSTSTTLKSINLSHVCLRDVPADILATTIHRMNRASLNWTGLTAVHLTKLLDTKNKVLDLRLEGINWEGVPAHLVIKYKMKGCMSIFRRHISSPGSL